MFALGYTVSERGFNLRREANPLATKSGSMFASKISGFNLRREANPLATRYAPGLACLLALFQSQARSQSPGDASVDWGGNPIMYVFQSQARSQSPGDSCRAGPISPVSLVSISGEKPIPWRLDRLMREIAKCDSFNLRREANPLATRSRRKGRRSPSWVSISGEKPIPWRQYCICCQSGCPKGFNLRREANPLATAECSCSCTTNG